MNKELSDKLAKALCVDGETQKVLDVNSEHPLTCRCEGCKEWWRLCGPDEAGMYGPFTIKEIKG